MMGSVHVVRDRDGRGRRPEPDRNSWLCVGVFVHGTDEAMEEKKVSSRIQFLGKFFNNRAHEHYSGKDIQYDLSLWVASVCVFVH